MATTAIVREGRRRQPAGSHPPLSSVELLVSAQQGAPKSSGIGAHALPVPKSFWNERPSAAGIRAEQRPGPIPWRGSPGVAPASELTSRRALLIRIGRNTVVVDIAPVVEVREDMPRARRLRLELTITKRQLRDTHQPNMRQRCSTANETTMPWVV